MGVFRRVTDCEGCRKRREALVAAGYKVVDWLKHPVGPAPPMPINPTPTPIPNRLPDAAPPSQEKVGRVDSRGRVRE